MVRQDRGSQVETGAAHAAAGWGEGVKAIRIILSAPAIWWLRLLGWKQVYLTHSLSQCHFPNSQQRAIVDPVIKPLVAHRGTFSGNLA